MNDSQQAVQIHQFDTLNARVSALEANLQANTAATNRIESNTSALVDAFANLQGAMKVLNWIGGFAKPLGYIAAAVAAVLGLLTALKTGVGPKP